MKDSTPPAPQVPPPQPFTLDQLWNAAAELVNPPDEQIEAARNASEEQATTVENTGQLTLPTFTPPSNGLTVTSELTSNTYTIGAQIGEGSFGTVYEATDVWLNELAVKVLKPIGTYEQIQIAANQEFGKLLTLRHPNVTHVADAFEYQHTFYIITERCYAPLANLFSLEKIVGSVWVRPVARCLLQAVHFLHISGYVHQDIHFGNVFMLFHRNEMGEKLSDTMTFKLGDLGITKLFSEIDAQNTLLNQSMLPPEFLDPAQFGQLGPRVDIYHCGLIFLQLMVNRPLVFSRDEILQGVPRTMAEQLPAPYNTALSKALRRHVAQRTQSALELWRDLSVTVPVGGLGLPAGIAAMEQPAQMG